MSKSTVQTKKAVKEQGPVAGEQALFDRLHTYIRSHQKFIITTHVVPDGDGLGGEIALSIYLKELGKECWIINTDPTPEKFKLVDPDDDIQIWKEGMELPEADIIFGVDVNDAGRIGPIHAALQKMKGQLVFIDHHILDGPEKANHIIDDQISSMGEFFFRYFKYVGVEVNFKMALAMYVSITTDTKQFRHRKTTSLSHAIAAALVDIGVDPEWVHNIVHQTRTAEEIRLFGEALKDLKTTADRKIAWLEVPHELQKKYGATAEESQGFVDHLLVLKNIDIGILFRDEGNGHVKVSLRSKGRVEIYPIAKKFGGGGHAFEAGMLLKGTLSEVVEKVLDEIKPLVA